jgi:hypothetical protein
LDFHYRVPLVVRRSLVKIPPLVVPQVWEVLLVLRAQVVLRQEQVALRVSRPQNRRFSMSVLSSREKFLRDQPQSALRRSHTY